MSFIGVSFSNFFYDDNIGKYWMVSFKSNAIYHWSRFKRGPNSEKRN